MWGCEGCEATVLQIVAIVGEYGFFAKSSEPSIW